MTGRRISRGLPSNASVSTGMADTAAASAVAPNTRLASATWPGGGLLKAGLPKAGLLSTALLSAVLLAGCALAPPPAAAPSTDPDCPGALVAVSDAAGLSRALAGAAPGQAIVLAPGEYAGQFATDRTGTAADPIRLCGSGATLRPPRGYGLHLRGADHWIIRGLAISGGSKGLVLDATSHTSISEVVVTGTGQEAVHLRAGSSDNQLTGLRISNTGRSDPSRGEAVYVGSAKSNWCRYSNCQPDASDRNRISDSVFGPGVTAEAVDAKEGTEAGVVSGNHFLAAGMSGADSWVDLKGNGWLVEDNRGTGAPSSALRDGIQIHEVLAGWGRRNTVSDNRLDIQAAGYGVWVQRSSAGNLVSCSNTAPTAEAGLANVKCRK